MPTPTKSWIDRQRDIIRQSRIVTRLACFVEEIPDPHPQREHEGVVKMTANQIRAALGLLDKVMPGLQIVANTTPEGVVEMTEKEAIRELVRLSKEHPEVAQALAEFHSGPAKEKIIESNSYTEVTKELVRIPVYREKTGESDTKPNKQ